MAGYLFFLPALGGVSAMTAGFTDSPKRRRPRHLQLFILLAIYNIYSHSHIPVS